MKKIYLIIVFLAVFVMVFSGCGGSSPFEESTGPVVEHENYVIRVWPNGDIPYYFDASFSEAEKNSMREWMMQMEEKVEGTVAFREVDSIDNFVCSIIKSDEGNYARLGYSKTSHLHIQDVNMGTFKHEMFHVMGFEHEFKRPDREDWIIVHYENINEKYSANAAISRALLYDWTKHDFDFESISLRSYGPYSFSSNGEVVFDGMMYEGHSNLSDGDAAKTIEVYGG